MNARTISAVEGDFIDGQGADDPDLNQAFWDFAESIKQEADAGGSVAVFEVPTDANGTPRPTTYNKTKLFTVPIGSCTLDDICDRVLREFVEPGGKIMIQLLARKNGERGVKLNRMIPLKRSKNSAADNGTSAGQIENLMRMMNEQRARDLADMRGLIEQNRAPQVDSLGQGLAIAKEITAMTVAARAGVVPGAVMPANDPNTMMNQMMALMMTTMMKKFLSGMDGNREEKPDNNSWLKDVVELAKPLLEAKAAAEKTAAVRETRMLAHERAQQAAPAPADQTTPHAPAQPEPTIQEQNNMKLFAVLEAGLPSIIEHGARKEADAATLAKMVMDELPEADVGLNDAFFQLIQSPKDEFLAKLSVIDARAKDHPEWFEEFRLALLAEFDPDERVPQVQGKAP